MPSPEAIKVAESIAELLANEDVDDDLKIEVAAKRIDGFHQSRREEIVKECSNLALRIGNAANSAAQRAACIAISKSIKDLRKPSDQRIKRIADAVQIAFSTLLSKHELDESFAQRMATELVNEHHLIVQWVTRVGADGLRVKANGVTIEVEAAPTELSNDSE
jgi:hypothetical protein